MIKRILKDLECRMYLLGELLFLVCKLLGALECTIVLIYKNLYDNLIKKEEGG